MVIDLFKSKKEKLWDWIKTQRLIRTSSIIKWGVNNYCNGADRLARQFREEGMLRRLTRQEMIFYGFGKTKEKIYEVVK